MKKRFLILVSVLCVFMLCVFAACKDKPEDNNPPEVPSVRPVADKTVTETKVVAYDGPNLLETSDKVGVSVEGIELFVYETRVNHNRIFSYTASQYTNSVVVFDFEGKITVTVTVKGAGSLSDVVVRPLSYEIEPSVSGNTITFELSYNGNYTMEYKTSDGEVAADNAVHIFANPLEENPISADDVPSDVIYIGPGVYDAGAIPMTSGQTLYLAGGAYVYGQVRAENLDGITIRGRGILDGSVYQRTKESEYTLPIELRRCTDVTIEGIAILDPAGWAVTLYFCDGVNVDNLKIMTARANGDGISVQSCKNVSVKGGFVRTWDDSLVVKNSDLGSTSNIVFDGVTVWTDLAQSCEVGYETYGATMDNIVFRNITILHNYHKACLSVHNSDQAVITNVAFRNITVEEAFNRGDNQNSSEDDYFIDMTVAYNENWTHSGAERGSISGVVFDNIDVLARADTLVCRFNGESAASSISGVSITNVTMSGVNITDAEGLKVRSNAYASDVTVSGGAEATGSLYELPYKLELADDSVDVAVRPSVAQSGLTVPDFAILDIEETYMGVKLDTSGISVTATHGAGTTVRAEYDDGTGVYETAENPLVNLLDGSRDSSWKSKAWLDEADEFIALTFDFAAPSQPGVLRIYMSERSAFVYDFNIGVFVKRTAESASYARALSTSVYSVSPARGNYFDLKLPTNTSCVSLQLRIYRTGGMRAQEVPSFAEVAFYPSSLSTNKPITDSTPYYDVYTPDHLVDGNDNTYWEAELAEGAFFTVDLGDVYNVKYIIMHLPALLTWEARTQGISIMVSVDNAVWTTVAEDKVYTFDPATGNSNSVMLDNAVAARYVKLVWSSNSSNGNYGAQLSELYVYGE